jgi:hypothetical protein
MKQKTTEQQSSSLILMLTIPEELFLLIMSLISTEAHLELAHTCKELHDYYKQSYSKPILTVLCKVQHHVEITKYIRVLERRMHQSGWIRTKVKSKMVSEKDAQNNSEYPIKVLCLYNTSQLPTGLDYVNLNALVMEFPCRENSMPSISFEGLKNLKSLSLFSANFSGDMMLMLSKLPLLEFISLSYCTMAEGDFTKIFELFTKLEEIQLLFCATPDFVNPVKFPPQLKRLKIKDTDMKIFTKMDFSLCTQLSYL